MNEHDKYIIHGDANCVDCEHLRKTTEDYSAKCRVHAKKKVKHVKVNFSREDIIKIIRTDK